MKEKKYYASKSKAYVVSTMYTTSPDVIGVAWHMGSLVEAYRHNLAPDGWLAAGDEWIAPDGTRGRNGYYRGRLITLADLP